MMYLQKGRGFTSNFMMLFSPVSCNNIHSPSKKINLYRQYDLFHFGFAVGRAA